MSDHHAPQFIPVNQGQLILPGCVGLVRNKGGRRPRIDRRCIGDGFLRILGRTFQKLKKQQRPAARLSSGIRMRGQLSQRFRSTNFWGRRIVGRKIAAIFLPYIFLPLSLSYVESSQPGSGQRCSGSIVMSSAASPRRRGRRWSAGGPMRGGNKFFSAARLADAISR